MSDNIKQELDTLWIKYQKTLEMLDQTLDELDQKPKEVEVIKEVEKIVEVEAKIDLSTPSAVIELEAKLAKKLNKDVSLL